MNVDKHLVQSKEQKKKTKFEKSLHKLRLHEKNPKDYKEIANYEEVMINFSLLWEAMYLRISSLHLTLVDKLDQL